MNEKRIQLLDCTLRDGGHLNDGKFGKQVIQNIIKQLVEAKVDIIEVGFLWDTYCDDDTARYHTISEVKKVLPEKKKQSRYSLMADFIDLEHLEPYDGTIDFIRLSFKRHRLGWAMKTGELLKKKGYKIFINPVNCNVYTDEQYLDVIHQVNQLKPYGFSVVDTFGVMRIRDLTYRYGLVEKNLDKNIVVGLHLHENLGLAYSLAQQFLQLADPKRRITIDGSLLGIGRIPGNLCIEQIMDHLNCEYGKNYDLEPTFDAIDDYIAPIKRTIPWGYAIPYALSAKYNLHRTYAEFLMNKWKLKTSDIERILSQVCIEESELFHEDYIEGLYRDYMSVKIDDNKAIKILAEKWKHKKIVLIASGASINHESDNILKFKANEDCITIGIHCIPNFMELDYVFFSNIKRYETLKVLSTDAEFIFTSNLTRYGFEGESTYMINYSRLAYHGDEYCDDSVLMVLNLLNSMGIKKVAIAGFDGIIGEKGNFYIEALSRNDKPVNDCDTIKQILIKRYTDMNITFLTKSFYENYKECLPRMI